MTEKESIARGKSDDEGISSVTWTMRGCLRWCQLQWFTDRMERWDVRNTAGYGHGDTCKFADANTRSIPSLCNCIGRCGAVASSADVALKTHGHVDELVWKYEFGFSSTCPRCHGRRGWNRWASTFSCCIYQAHSEDCFPYRSGWREKSFHWWISSSPFYPYCIFLIDPVWHRNGFIRLVLQHRSKALSHSMSKECLNFLLVGSFFGRELESSPFCSFLLLPIQLWVTIWTGPCFSYSMPCYHLYTILRLSDCIQMKSN